MATPITMPRLGESVTEGTISRWMKAEGEQVEKDEPLCEVETDKVNAEVPSPFSGTVEKLLVETGQTVAVDTEIALLATVAQTASGEEEAAVAVPEQGSPSNGSLKSAEELRLTRSSPVVRRLAAEHGIDISGIPGTGIGGRVTKKDIEGYIGTREAVSPSPARTALQEGDRVVELTPTRRTIARRMSESKREAPHAWCMVEVDVSGLVARREREKEGLLREGLHLTYLPYIVEAVVYGLIHHPQLNSVWDGDRIVLRRRITPGIAVDTEEGLVVPVIHDADELSFTGLARRIDSLVRRAREGGLTVEDVSGGTFTVNNPGALGSVVSTPIINYPQAAILSAEAIVKRPVVVDGDAIAVRSMMNVEVSFDHRVLDGGAVLRFLGDVRRRLEGY